jgi:hypothetical protein
MTEQPSDDRATGKKRTLAEMALGRKIDANAILELRFINEVKHLANLKTFLLAEAISVRPEHIKLFALGDLNQLWFSEGGRPAKAEEWNLLDERAQVLSSYLTVESRKRLQLTATPGFVAWLPIFLIVTALSSLVIAIGIEFLGLTAEDAVSVRFVSYLVWLMCLGSIGAIAFISMNALSIQSDATFDLTNRKLLTVRIVLGSLFGVVLSIPFGFASFLFFCNSITNAAYGILPAAAEGTGEAVVFSIDAALLLLPFILGFSTSLVVLVLNRFVESISTFFGQQRDAVQKSNPPPMPPNPAVS